MKKTEWMKDGPRHILIRGNHKATINKKRQLGIVKYWAAISEFYGGQWFFLRNLPPCDTLAEMKQLVEDYDLFVTSARRKELAEIRRRVAQAQAEKYKPRPETTGDEWWHK